MMASGAVNNKKSDHSIQYPSINQNNKIDSHAPNRGLGKELL